MAIKFNCPACGAPMEYDGETTLFQTCRSCGAPIVVPAEVIDENRALNAGLTSNTVAGGLSFDENPGETVQPTPLDDPKLVANAGIFEETNAGNKIAAIKIHREAFNTDLQTSKEAIEALSRDIERSKRSHSEAIQEELSGYEGDQTLKIILSELKAGRKIQAIKVFRETFHTGLKEAKEAVEAMERGESINLSDYL